MSGDFEPADDVFEKPKHGMPYDDIKRKRRSVSRVGCIGMIVFFAVLFCGITAAVWLLVSPMISGAGDTANGFMLALRDKRYQAAYDLGTRDFQREVEHPENLIVLLKHPRDWQFNNFNIRNGSGTVRGSVQFDDGEAHSIAIFLQQEQDGWKISGIHY